MDIAKHPHIDLFDSNFTTQRIRILKVLFPYLDEPVQRTMAIYIKFSELQTVFHGFQKNMGCNPFFNCHKEFGNFCELFSEISPFCPKEEKEQIDKFVSAYENFERYKELMNTMELMSELMPKEDSVNLFSGTDIFKDFLNNGEPNTNDKTETDKAETDGTGKTGNMNGMSDMLLGILSPEQKELFEMLGGITDAN